MFAVTTTLGGSETQQLRHSYARAGSRGEVCELCQLCRNPNEPFKKVDHNRGAVGQQIRTLVS
jgi:hypothetical protein